MNKEDFMEEIKRLEQVRTKVCVQHLCCKDCEFGGYCHDSSYIGDLWDYAESIKITRQSEFLKQFPNAKLFNAITGVVDTYPNGTDGVISICPNCLDATFVCHNEHKNCHECQKDYWLGEIEESEEECQN